MRCIRKQNLQSLQKALLMNINGTKLLLQILMENNWKYLLSSRINQDALENLFSKSQSRGGFKEHPSPLNALHKLRMIILGKNIDIVSSSSNITDQNQYEFLVAATFNRLILMLKVNLKYLNIKKICPMILKQIRPLKMNHKLKNQKTTVKWQIVEHLAGWVAKKYKLKFPEIGSITAAKKSIATNEHDYLMPSWINHLSYGGLITLSSDLFKKIAQGFHTKWGFPHCIGSIDGKHIRIKCPANSGSMYYNYNHFFFN